MRHAPPPTRAAATAEVRPRRCGGCGTRHRVSPTSGYCPRCTFEVRRQAARSVTAHPARRPAWPAPARRWGP